MCCLDLFSQFDMTIHHVPGKSNVIDNALLHYPDLSAIVVSVESSSFIQICEAYAAACG